MRPAACRISQGGKAISKDLRVNQMIRAREVRLIDEENRQLGVVMLREALRIASEKGLDLVEVAPTAQPVVCRIMDYGRYKYEQAKRDREARKKQLVVDVKELKMGPNIEDHDFEVRVKSAERFLNEGDKIKATIQFRGRQIQHSVLGRQVLARFAERLRELAAVEAEPRMEGRNMHVILAPRPEVLARARAGRSEGQEAAAGAGADAAAQPGTAGERATAHPAAAAAAAEERPAAPEAAQGPRPGQSAAEAAPTREPAREPARAPSVTPVRPPAAAGGAGTGAVAGGAQSTPQRAPVTPRPPLSRPAGAGGAPMPAARPPSTAPGAAAKPPVRRASPR